MRSLFAFLMKFLFYPYKTLFEQYFDYYISVILLSRFQNSQLCFMPSHLQPIYYRIQA